MAPTATSEVACFCGPPRFGLVLCGGWWKFWNNRNRDCKDDAKDIAGRVVVNVVPDNAKAHRTTSSRDLPYRDSEHNGGNPVWPRAS